MKFYKMIKNERITTLQDLLTKTNLNKRKNSIVMRIIKQVKLILDHQDIEKHHIKINKTIIKRLKSNILNKTNNNGKTTLRNILNSQSLIQLHMHKIGGEASLNKIKTIIKPLPFKWHIDSCVEDDHQHLLSI